MGRLVNLGALRRNPNRPASVRTVDNLRQCLTRVARDLEAQGLELRDLTPETAVAWLEAHAHFGQKHLDMHRQAIQAVLVHVTGRLPKGARLPVVRSSQPPAAKGRACTPAQYRRIAAAQTAPHALATAIAHAAGLRAHELLTLARPDERPPDRRPGRASKFAGRPGLDYTVVGKGGLVRLVRLPHDLAERLEERRLAEPVRVTDRGVHYLSRYNVGAGRRWSASFSAASRRALGWTTGAHSCRHAYAQERMRELQRDLPRRDALETVSQELGHFLPEKTEAYLR